MVESEYIYNGTDSDVNAEGEESARNDSFETEPSVSFVWGGADPEAVIVPFGGKASTLGYYGELQIDWEGNFTYTLYNDGGDLSGFPAGATLRESFSIYLNDGTEISEEFAVRIESKTTGWDAFVNPLLDYQKRCQDLRERVAAVRGVEPSQVGRIQAWDDRYNAELPGGYRFVSKREVEALA